MKQRIFRTLVPVVLAACVACSTGCDFVKQLSEDAGKWKDIPTATVVRPAELPNGWQEYRLPGLECEVRTPCLMKEIDKSKLNDDNVRAFACNDGELVYVVSVVEGNVDSDSTFSIVAASAEAAYVSDMKKDDPTAELKPEKKLSMKPNFGRQSRVIEGAKTHVMRVVGTKKFVYVMICNGETELLDSRVDAFMDGALFGPAT